MAARATPSRDAAATPPAAPSNGQILHHQPPSIRRHLPFSSMNPPFVSPHDYHRFSTPGRAADHLSEALVIKSPPLKRKNVYQNNEVEPSEWTASTVHRDIANNPLRTPVSAKGGRPNCRSKATKNNRSLPSTPISNADAPSPVTPASCRFDSSLSTIIL